MNNGDMPAMPLNVEIWECSTDPSKGTVDCYGLTKREHFAGLAMQACRSRLSNYPSWSDLVSDAVEIADALLKELEK
jgi:hypothetical protein